MATASSQEIEGIKNQVPRPPRAVVTAGMPYANGPIHLGHLAGAHVPADIYARWLRMLIGPEDVLFVSGTDDHGSATELAAHQAGASIREFIDTIHAQQRRTLERYGIALDVYSGTSRPDCFPIQKAVAQDFLRRLHTNGLLEKRVTVQWYDPTLERFLQDRFVRGRCPNPKCDNESAYSEECDRCGRKYEPTELISPRSALSDAGPELERNRSLVAGHVEGVRGSPRVDPEQGAHVADVGLSGSHQHGAAIVALRQHLRAGLQGRARRRCRRTRASTRPDDRSNCSSRRRMPCSPPRTRSSCWASRRISSTVGRTAPLPAT